MHGDLKAMVEAVQPEAEQTQQRSPPSVSVHFSQHRDFQLSSTK